VRRGIPEKIKKVPPSDNMNTKTKKIVFVTGLLDPIIGSKVGKLDWVGKLSFTLTPSTVQYVRDLGRL
jgi:hypothetical protein